MINYDLDEFRVKYMGFLKSGKYKEAKMLCLNFINSNDRNLSITAYRYLFRLFIEYGVVGHAKEFKYYYEKVKSHGISNYFEFIDNVYEYHFKFKEYTKRERKEIETYINNGQIENILSEDWVTASIMNTTESYKDIEDIWQKIVEISYILYNPEFFSKERNILHIKNLLEKKKSNAYYSILSEQIPFYTGETAKNVFIYHYDNSGLGDFIKNSRMLKHLSKIVEKIYLFSGEKYSKFLPLYEDNFKEKLTVIYKERPLDKKLAEENIECFCNIASPALIKDFYEDLSVKISNPLLKADASKVLFYKNNYFNNNDFKIGIKWMGGILSGRDINVDAFKILYDMENVKFYSLQVGEGYEFINKIKKHVDIIDLGATFKDFTDTAAAIENLDLLICNDTSLLHLAGAMGKRCFGLCQEFCDKQWWIDFDEFNSFECRSSRLYESVHLFRQKSEGEWEELMERVKMEIKKIIFAKSKK